MNNNKFSYKDRINAICSYFGVSEPAAKYMYHRRRRCYPYKKETDHSFIPWTIKLQNAIISADRIATIDWENLKFDDDVKTLIKHGIDVETQPNKIQVNKISQTTKLPTRRATIDGKGVEEETDNEFDDGGEWTVVSTNKGQLIKRHMLRTMGFLPKANMYNRSSVKK